MAGQSNTDKDKPGRETKRPLLPDFESLKKLSPGEIHKAIQEMQIKQLELELQNEELKKSYGELEESHKELKGLYESAPVGYVSLNENFKIVKANRTFCRIIGIERQSVIGKTLSDYVTSDSKKEIIPFFKNDENAGESNYLDLEFILPDSGKIFVRINFKKWVNDKGDTFYRVIVTDVNEIKEIESSLLKSESSLKEAQAFANVGNWELDLATRQVQASDEVFNIYGLSGMSGYIPLELIRKGAHPEDRPKNEEVLQTLIKKGSKYGHVYRIIRKNDGRMRWVNTHAKVIKNDKGEPEKIVGTIQDITESKKLQRALEKSEKRRRIISGLISDSIYVLKVRPDGVLKFEWIDGGNNDGGSLDFSQVDSSETWLERIHEDDRNNYRNKIKLLLEGKESVSEYRILDEKRNLYWIRDYAKPFYNKSKTDISYIYGAIQDISSRKKIEEQLHSQNQRLKTIFETIPGYITVTGPGLKITSMNSNAVKFFGFSNIEECIGKDFREIYGQKGMAKNSSIEKAIKQGRPVSKITELKDDKSGDFSYKIDTNPILDDNAQILGAVEIFTDISSLKKAERRLAGLIQELKGSRDVIETQLIELGVINAQLKQSESQLQELNSSKDKFFSIIAHDLRNPLNGFINLTEILSQDLSDLSISEIQSLSKALYDSSQSLFKLLENLLTWSRAQTSSIEFNPVRFDLYEVIFDSMFLFQKMADEKEIELNFDSAQGKFVKADYNMIGTVARNLISNAVKFTKRDGKVKITIGEQGRRYRVSVKDSGIGIPEKEIDGLFRIDRTFRSDGTEHEKGTGLGLVVSSEFILKHNSKIEVNSKIGKGAEFSFCLDKSD